VVYLLVESNAGIISQFVCAKTSIAPIKTLTIPRLELLLLARLISSIGCALENEIEIGTPTCYSDSQVALYWIKSQDKN